MDPLIFTFFTVASVLVFVISVLVILSGDRLTGSGSILLMASVCWLITIFISAMDWI